MGRFTEGMTNLRDQIDTLRTNRVDLITGLKQGMSQLKSDVSDMRQGFRDEHNRMAEEGKNNLKTFISETESYVSTLKKNATDMKVNIRSDHATMASKLKDDLNGFSVATTATVSDLMNLFRENRAKMSANMKHKFKDFLAETNQYVASLKIDVANMKDSFRNDHADMAVTLKEDLQKFASGIKSIVTDLEQRFRDEHIETTGKAMVERKRFIDDVNRSLSQLKLQTTNMLREINDDMVGAHLAWYGSKPAPAGKETAAKITSPAKVKSKPDIITPPLDVHSKPKTVEPLTNAQEGEESAEKLTLTTRQETQDKEEIEDPQEVPEFLQNDLTQINGIGPVMSRRLNDAGIFSFAKLASSTIEELRAALGESARLANLEVWIKEAMELSS